jgi:flagellar biogenesis protein FliO
LPSSAVLSQHVKVDATDPDATNPDAAVDGEAPNDGAAEPAASAAGTAQMEKSVKRICILAAVLLLLWGLVRSMRRCRCRLGTLGRDRGTSAIHIANTLHLGPKHYLAVAVCEQKKFLIGISPHSIGLISPLEATESANLPTKNASPLEKLP